MAPGCTIINDHSQHQISDYSNSSDHSIKDKELNQIPLPENPPLSESQPVKETKPAGQNTQKITQNSKVRKSPSFRTLDTVDSFEILEQTIMKQKRLGKIKNTDLRKKVLLKRTFNLVCEMMDQENGYECTNNNSNHHQDTVSNSASMSLDYTQEQKEDGDQFLQETLIINLNETESLDSSFQDELDTVNELNYTDLENFNYANLLENEQPIITTTTVSSVDEEIGCLDKNKSFLSNDFFNESATLSDLSTTQHYNGSIRSNKRRRSSADDDTDFDECMFDMDESDEDDTENVSEKKNQNSNGNSFYMFSDLTNSKNKKRCIRDLDSNDDNEFNGDTNVNNKNLTESINIVT